MPKQARLYSHAYKVFKCIRVHILFLLLHATTTTTTTTHENDDGKPKAAAGVAGQTSFMLQRLNRLQTSDSDAGRARADYVCVRDTHTWREKHTGCTYTQPRQSVVMYSCVQNISNTCNCCTNKLQPIQLYCLLVQ